VPPRRGGGTRSPSPAPTPPSPSAIYSANRAASEILDDFQLTDDERTFADSANVNRINGGTPRQAGDGEEERWRVRWRARPSGRSPFLAGRSIGPDQQRERDRGNVGKLRLLADRGHGSRGSRDTRVSSGESAGEAAVRNNSLGGSQAASGVTSRADSSIGALWLVPVMSSPHRRGPPPTCLEYTKRRARTRECARERARARANGRDRQRK